MKQRKLARYAQRQSCMFICFFFKLNFILFIIKYFILVRRTLQINLNDEERAEVFGTGKN
jgi:hypothetical protein